MLPKFKALHDHTMERFLYGGVQVHDYVEIANSDIDGANEQMKEAIKYFKDSGQNIKVMEIHNKSAEDGPNTPDMFSATLGLEISGGMFENKIVVPVENLKVLSWNVPPSIPDKYYDKRELEEDGEPQELKATTDYNGFKVSAALTGKPKSD